jgi:hypothetical protein
LIQADLSKRGKDRAILETLYGCGLRGYRDLFFEISIYVHGGKMGWQVDVAGGWNAAFKPRLKCAVKTTLFSEIVGKTTYSCSGFYYR